MTREKQKQIINNTLKVFSAQEWFRDVIVYAKHPDSDMPTIEFKVNYIPTVELKNIISFSQAAGCYYFFTVVDKNGNKAN